MDKEDIEWLISWITVIIIGIWNKPKNENRPPKRKRRKRKR